MFPYLTTYFSSSQLTITNCTGIYFFENWLGPLHLIDKEKLNLIDLKALFQLPWKKKI